MRKFYGKLSIDSIWSIFDHCMWQIRFLLQEPNEKFQRTRARVTAVTLLWHVALVSLKRNHTTPCLLFEFLWYYILKNGTFLVILITKIFSAETNSMSNLKYLSSLYFIIKNHFSVMSSFQFWPSSSKTPFILTGGNFVNHSGSALTALFSAYSTFGNIFILTYNL